LTQWAVKEGYVLSPAAVVWVSQRGVQETVRFPEVLVTDTTCKTSNTVLEYGVVMGKDNRQESFQGMHYHLNGTNKANYRFVYLARRLLLGSAVSDRTEIRMQDGDPWLQQAALEDADNASAARGLCAFHAVNIPARVTAAQNGFDGAERALMSDLTDKVHKMFRGCETEAELKATHTELVRQISTNTIPTGPTNVRRRERDAKGGSTEARRTSADPDGVAGPPSKMRKKSDRKNHRVQNRKKKYRVQRFLRTVMHLGVRTIEVKWQNFDDSTLEPVSALVTDLSPAVFAAYCRAADIVLSADALEDVVTSRGGGSAAPSDGHDDEDVYTVQRFVGVNKDGTVKVAWAGYSATTSEPPAGLMHDLGEAQFDAFCAAAGIDKGNLQADYESNRDATVTIATILKTWYLEQIWSKQHALAACFHRGQMVIGNWTSGAAESNFRITKQGGDGGGVSTKTSLKELAGRVRRQTEKRYTNIDAGRTIEFSRTPAADRYGWVPETLLNDWTRPGLRRINEQARLGGLPSTLGDGAAAKAAPTYHIWNVEPPSGSGADAAWVLRRAGAPADGGQHRVRTVLRIGGRDRCTCCTWEFFGVACRHVLALHGSVAVTSVYHFCARAQRSVTTTTSWQL
jgi:hypothetical protein